MTYVVKQKSYSRPGQMTWKEINRFNNPAEADEWLTAWIRVNHFIGSDFTIVVK